jgi:hypothetical protein
MCKVVARATAVGQQPDSRGASLDNIPLRTSEQAEVRVAREKGRRRGALAAKQESELAAARAEVAATRAAAESAQRIANAAADDKKRLQVGSNRVLYC